MTDEFGGYFCLDALEFVVQGGKRDGDAEGLVQEGGTNRREGRSDDLPHEIDDGREGQLACVLCVGLFLEQGIQRLGRQRPFQEAPRHHCEGCFFRESLEDLAQQHGFPRLPVVVSFFLPCYYSEFRSPWKGWPEDERQEDQAGDEAPAHVELLAEVDQD